MSEAQSERPIQPVLEPSRDSRMILRFVRIGFVLLMVLLTMLYVIRVGSKPTGEFDVGLAITWWIPVLIALLLAMVFLAVDVFTPTKKIQVVSGVAFGLIAGLLAAWAIGSVIDLVIATWDIEPSRIIPALKVLLGVSLSFLGISTVLQTQDEFRLVIPYVEFAKQRRGPRPVLLDTSVLVDGRVVAMAGTGVVQQPMLIPGFVLEELQTLADSKDRAKRTAGRRGLDNVARLQRLGNADVSIDTTPVTRRAVDQMLIELASTMPGSIMTTDTGLARVAAIQQVSVLNINEISDALKPAVLPGQVVTIELVRKGEHPGQAVGFLDDGTMVVAEDGEGHLGEKVDMTLTSSMQTAAGRLLFARIAPESEPAMPDAAAESDAPHQQKRSPIGPVRDGIDRPSARNPRR
ncbi:MAG: PIN/TRAM domain-containing protein [Planctomycetota bacterium]